MRGQTYSGTRPAFNCFTATITDNRRKSCRITQPCRSFAWCSCWHRPGSVVIRSRGGDVGQCHQDRRPEDRSLPRMRIFPALGPRSPPKWRQKNLGIQLPARQSKIVSADHQNKPDIGLGIASTMERFDNENVDVVADISSSGVGFAILPLANARNKVVLNASASSDFTGKACSHTLFQWVYNSYSNGYGLAAVLTKQGLDTLVFPHGRLCVRSRFCGGHAQSD